MKESGEERRQPMIVTRDGVDWVVESPSRWVLCGIAGVRVEWSGIRWWLVVGRRRWRMRSREAGLKQVEKLVKSGAWKRVEGEMQRIAEEMGDA